MKDFIAWWVFIQLVLIGMIGGRIVRQIDQEVYVCHTEKMNDKTGIMLTSLAFPMIYLTGNFTEDYCEKQLSNKK